MYVSCTLTAVGKCRQSFAASYSPINILKESIPEGIETLVNPQDLLASPSGQHTFGRPPPRKTNFVLQSSIHIFLNVAYINKKKKCRCLQILRNWRHHPIWSRFSLQLYL